MLTIADVHKSFGKHRVLDGASLSVERGEICVLRGSNGAGKSTLCEVIAGVLDADSGSVLVDGQPIRRPAARAAIGYAPANATLPEHLFLYEWIDLVGALRSATSAEIDAAIATWGLSSCTDSRLSALSLGQRRRLALAAAELGSPRWILLDEPTVGIDPAGQALLVERVSAHVARGGGALVASHEPDLDRALGARVIHLDGGRISRSANPSSTAH